MQQPNYEASGGGGPHRRCPHPHSRSRATSGGGGESRRFMFYRAGCALGHHPLPQQQLHSVSEPFSHNAGGACCRMRTLR
jgi:hypothetical protein